MSNHELTSDKVKKSDEYYTKEYAIIPLLDYIPSGATIWCPFDKKESNYVKLLREHGCRVIFGHIDDGKDFFKYEPKDYDYIISNPPYSLREKILERLYSIGKPFALLINVSGLFGSKVRFNLFKENQFEIMVFDKRIKYITLNERKGDSPPFDSIYLCSKILPTKFVFKKLSSTKD